MAKKHITQMIDDLDGTVLERGTTLTFSLEGRSYEIDLSDENAQKLRDAFRPYISVGRAVGAADARPRRTASGRAIPTRDLVDVRSWALQNRHSVNHRGRISAAVLKAYDDAH